MRVFRSCILCALLILFAGCDRETEPTLSEPPVPAMDVAGDSWTLTAYYWDNGWVKISAMEDRFLSADLQIGFNAHNWGPTFPGFSAGFDNVRAYGDIDLVPGVIEDFDAGFISDIWNEGPGQCAVWRATACVDQGVLVADIPQGSDNGLFRMVGLNTRELVVHGEFDVQIDFDLDPTFHAAPSGETNVMLCVWTEGWARGFCAQNKSGYYATWIGLDGTVPEPVGYFAGVVYRQDLQGKLRITRTRVHKGPVVESVSGNGSFTTADGDWRTFSFSARRHADGTVDGQWERIRRADGNAADSKSHGVVTCLTVVGNEAWIGGIATSGLNSTPPNRVAWRVVDNGQGSLAAPDQISGQYWLAGRSFPAFYCADMSAAPDLHDIEAGNIKVGR